VDGADGADHGTRVEHEGPEGHWASLVDEDVGQGGRVDVLEDDEVLLPEGATLVDQRGGRRTNRPEGSGFTLEALGSRSLVGQRNLDGDAEPVPCACRTVNDTEAAMPENLVDAEAARLEVALELAAELRASSGARVPGLRLR
jgi:hypothetical protein